MDVRSNFREKKKKKRFDFEVFFTSWKFVMMVICDKGGIKGRLSVG